MLSLDNVNKNFAEFVCSFLIFGLITWYCYYLYCFTYWKKKGVPSHPPRFPTGNITKPLLGQENISVTVKNFYNKFNRKGHKHAGLYFLNGPVYLPIDLEIVKHILTTDFEHFVDRGTFLDEQNCPLSSMLFSMKGLKWKKLRAKLSPMFSAGKLKSMYGIFMKVTEEFVDVVAHTAQKEDEINIKYISSNFTTDIILATGFGLEGGSLKNPNNRVGRVSSSLFYPSTWSLLKTVVIEGLQNPGNILKASVSSKFQQDFFQDLAEKTMKLRDENKIDRQDFFSLLLEAKDKEGFTFNEIVGQCYMFFLAGFDTSSQTISYCIHQLAHNKDMQDKLRKEIFENLGTDFRKYTYEDILKLPYLDKVFHETLRLYPVLGFLNRICIKPYKVPGTNVVLDKGTPVLISTLGLQHNPEYFPDPLKFDPERFSEDKPLIPFSFQPFGKGPRSCIGMRYGKLQTKLGIAALISQFKFLPSPKTPRLVELDKLAKSLVMITKKGIVVRVLKLQGQ
jgi:cytochrome P450 family 6